MTTYKPSFIPWFELHAVDHCNKSCVFCNNHSPFFKKKEYRAEEYFPWVDEMIRRNIDFGSIAIIGGEPFLHSDLTGFVKGFKDRYGKCMSVTSNCRWMSDQAIDDYAALFEASDYYYFTLYPDVIEQKGRGEVERMVEKIKARHPHIQVVFRSQQRAEDFKFVQFRFAEEPEEATSFCHAQAHCTNLLTNGRLARCAVGAYAKANPTVTQAFLNASTNHMFYDLSMDDGTDFGEWHSRWPLDPCRFCDMWKFKWAEWKDDPGIRKEGGMEKHLPIIA